MSHEYEDELERMRTRKQRERSGSKGRVAPERQSKESGSSRARKKRQSLAAKKKKRKLILTTVLALVVLVAGACFYMNRGQNKGYWTIAIFGVDSRDGNLGKGALSDVEIICNINKKTGEIKLVSVFRDTYLKIDSKGNYHKINEAYFKGGYLQATGALEENLDLKIDDYATFNWKSVADAINILGGIDLEITDAEFKYINSFITETVETTGIGSTHLEHAGMNHLDGVQAVAYARLRLMDTDYNRTERQRKVIGLAMEKAKNADISVLNNILVTVLPQLSTSIGISDLIPMAHYIKDFYIGESAGFPFSRATALIGKKDCVVPTTLESNVIQLHQFLYDKVDYKPSSAVLKISDQIAKDSGFSEVGKNAGSGGNSSGGSGGGNENKKPQPATEAETIPETSSIEETTEAVTEESSTEETTQIEEAESTKAEEIGPGVIPELTKPTNPTVETIGPGSEPSSQPPAQTKPQPTEPSAQETKPVETVAPVEITKPAGNENEPPAEPQGGPGV